MSELQARHRALQQGSEQLPREVSTPEELVNAIARGHRHIVIVAHLDLTRLPLIPNIACEEGCASPLPSTTSTLSIRVRAPRASRQQAPRGRS